MSGGPGTNTGHGHVWARPDGVKARCGGPAMCKVCAADQQRWSGGRVQARIEAVVTDLERDLVSAGAERKHRDDVPVGPIESYRAQVIRELAEELYRMGWRKP